MPQEITEKTPLNSFWVIISGLFTFRAQDIDQGTLFSTYYYWQNRIFDGNYQGTFQHLMSGYYDSYLNNSFPEIRYSNPERAQLNPKRLNHLTCQQCLTDPDIFRGVELWMAEGKKIGCSVEYLDLFLFPHEIGIISAKISLDDEKDLALGNVSEFLGTVRNLDAGITLPGTEGHTTIREFLEKNISSWLSSGTNLALYNPILKTYCSLDLRGPVPAEELDFLLYDLGNVSSIGSARGEGIFSPSADYFRELILNNKVSIFRNWSVLALHDTFTRISMDYPDPFRSWEYEYFNLYMHCLYIKFYMYLTNTELSDVTVVSKKTEHIRDNFIEFINDYYHSHISYKFLPNLLHKKIVFGLDIQSEVERMETKIQRINEHFQERREKSFNIALIIIAVLSVISVVYDASEWIIHLGLDREIMYPWLSITNGIIIFLLIYLIFRRGKR